MREIILKSHWSISRQVTSRRHVEPFAASAAGPAATSRAAAARKRHGVMSVPPHRAAGRRPEVVIPRQGAA